MTWLTPGGGDRARPRAMPGRRPRRSRPGGRSAGRRPHPVHAPLRPPTRRENQDPRRPKWRNRRLSGATAGGSPRCTRPPKAPTTNRTHSPSPQPRARRTGIRQHGLVGHAHKGADSRNTLRTQRLIPPLCAVAYCVIPVLVRVERGCAALPRPRPIARQANVPRPRRARLWGRMPRPRWARCPVWARRPGRGPGPRPRRAGPPGARRAAPRWDVRRGDARGPDPRLTPGGLAGQWRRDPHDGPAPTGPPS